MGVPLPTAHLPCPEQDTEARIVTREPVTVLALRHVGPYSEIGPAFGKLSGFVKAHGVPTRGMLGVYHDDPAVVRAAS